MSPEGNKAVQVLLKQFDAVTCVRLAVDDEANEKACAELATAFGSGLIRLQVMDENQRNAMAYELFGDRSRLQEQGLWQAFNQAVDALAGYAFKKAGELRYEKKIFARNDVYRDNFVLSGTDSIERGRFKRPDRDNPFLLELKKYVDLIYNVNLPDRLSVILLPRRRCPAEWHCKTHPAKASAMSS